MQFNEEIIHNYVRGQLNEYTYATGRSQAVDSTDVDAAVDKQFVDALSTLSPQNWSRTMVDMWKERLECYIENEDNDLNTEEWTALEASLKKFHEDILIGRRDSTLDGLHSISSDVYVKKAIEAIKLLKTMKWKIYDAFDEIYFDDLEGEVRRALNHVVDKAVLLVEGGKPFERTEIHWVDPTTDEEFNKVIYAFASAEQEISNAESIPWLLPARQNIVKLIPRDLITRLRTPLKIGDVDDHEDWEFSVTHPSDEEEKFARYESTYKRFRTNLKEVLTEEIQNYSTKVDTTASIDPALVDLAAKRLEAGEINVDFKSMLILPFDTNHCKLIGVRDESVGDMITYKEVLKPPTERIMDKNLRSDPNAWLDPERPAGPQVRTYGWEPLADLEDDLPPEETEMIKKKENPDALSAGSEFSTITKERAQKLIKSLKDKCVKRIEENDWRKDDTAPNRTIKDYLDRKGQRFGVIPEEFSMPQELLEALDMPKLREKDSGKSLPLENEVIPLEPDWLGLDGSGPHEQLTEELYWKGMESFKKPPSAPLVDWKSLLSQDVLENENDSDNEELKRYLAEITQIQEQVENDVPASSSVENNAQRGEKDTPARKRALDKEFVKEWVEKFGSQDGIQGFDPKTFKLSEHLVSSEEYEEKFLTHPYTSSYVFHPNFVRFRRMTRNHPTYSEYAFKKLESAFTLNHEANAEEFKSILAELEKTGPEVLIDDTQQLNEKNLGLEPQEAKRWDCLFSTYMTEGLTMLEHFAETSRGAFKKPDIPCKEELSNDLLYSHVEKYDAPEFLKEFQLEPFSLEDFGTLPPLEPEVINQVSSAAAQKMNMSDTAESDSSDSEESDYGDNEIVQQPVSWRPFKQFNGYQNVDVVQLLSNASQLIETSSPKRLQPPPRVMEWIQGKYKPSTARLKKWRKLYGSIFPKVDSPLGTPYLFLTEEEKMKKLKKSAVKLEISQDPTDPWALTEQEKAALKSSAAKADEIDGPQEEEEDKEAVAEKIELLEERSGICWKQIRGDEWAEELDTNEAPDMSVLGTPAMDFPFPLDNFQKQAIMALERGYNVFVSAHTSAGKTVVAEYAIALSRKRRSRAIYTSPIKALSNQKYNDFKKCFPSVGLITGDVQINESAECLIMTTEILRSMLYNSSEGIRDLEFVVLDEVHYMNDPERGHVWEEVLILLPANVQIVMLSATVPNYMEFTSWVGRNKARKVMVSKTLHRPVPLKHYFYCEVSKLKEKKKPSEGLYLLREGDGPIRRENWKEIQELIAKIDDEERKSNKSMFLKQKAPEGRTLTFRNPSEPEQPEKSGPNKQKMMQYFKKREKAQWVTFIDYLKGNSDDRPTLLPTIVFAFSRKKCDELADLLDTVDLTTPLEKLFINSFIQSQIGKLDQEDRNLPQIQTLKKHLKNGIGVHHSGILPVLKEIVELLFQQGKVKLLFATETFAMGVNMPARTVVFYSIEKFDGDERRSLHPAEYIQMAGRAGRRGEDTVGNVIIRCSTREAVKLSIEAIEAMMTGSPRTLKSQFRISYRMILTTLTARSQISLENMMQQSYHENNEQSINFKRENLLRIADEFENKQRSVIYSRYQEEYIERFNNMYKLIDDYTTMWTQLREQEIESPKFKREVSIGNFVKFRSGPVVDSVGIITKVTPTLDFHVLALRDKDRNGDLELPHEISQPGKWFKFLSTIPRPKIHKPKTDESVSLLQYIIKVDQIVEVYKESIALSEDKAAALVKNASLANMGGRLTGNSSTSSGLDVKPQTFLSPDHNSQLPQNVPYHLMNAQFVSNLAINTSANFNSCHPASVTNYCLPQTSYYLSPNHFPSSYTASISPGNGMNVVEPNTNQSLHGVNQLQSHLHNSNKDLFGKNMTAEDPLFNNPLSYEYDFLPDKTRVSNIESTSPAGGCKINNVSANVNAAGSNHETNLNPCSNPQPRQPSSCAPQCRPPVSLGQPIFYSHLNQPNPIRNMAGYPPNAAFARNPQFFMTNVVPPFAQRGFGNQCYSAWNPPLPAFRQPNCRPQLFIPSNPLHNRAQFTQTPVMGLHPGPHPMQMGNKPSVISPPTIPILPLNPNRVASELPKLQDHAEFPQLGPNHSNKPLQTFTSLPPASSKTEKIVNHPDCNPIRNISQSESNTNITSWNQTELIVPPLNEPSADHQNNKCFETKKPMCKINNVPNTIVKMSRKIPHRVKNYTDAMNFPVKLSSVDVHELGCNIGASPKFGNISLPVNPDAIVESKPSTSNPVEKGTSGSDLDNIQIADSSAASSLSSTGIQTSSLGTNQSSRLDTLIECNKNEIKSSKRKSTTPRQNPNDIYCAVDELKSLSSKIVSNPEDVDEISHHIGSPNKVENPPKSSCPQYSSQVIGMPNAFPGFQRRVIPQGYPIHNLTAPGAAMGTPMHFAPTNNWLLGSPIPANHPSMIQSYRYKTKFAQELENICLALRSPSSMKPFDELVFAKDVAYEHYQIMKFKEEDMKEAIKQLYEGHEHAEFVEVFAKIFKWREAVKTKESLRKQVAEQTLTLYPTYSNKLEVLKTMNYVIGDSVQMKGYMAARISKYELVVTEMLVRNVIKDLSPQEVAGLMSFIVYQPRQNNKRESENQDNDEEEPDPLPVNLEKAIYNTIAIITDIMAIEYEHRVESESSQLLDAFKIAWVMYCWAKQEPFSTVVEKADQAKRGIQEGMLVRWIQQLVEALKEIESAAKVMGDPAVPEKIQASIKSIKRGIVFAPSLYTTL